MATETFAVGSEEVTVALNIEETGDDVYQLTPVDMGNLNTALAAIPPGSAGGRVTVRLPAGTFENDVEILLEDKSFWDLLGGPTTLHYPTYGNLTGTLYARRHFIGRRLSDFHIAGFNIHGPHTVRDPNEPTNRALYVPNKEFQHGFQFADSQRVTLKDINIYEVGGDGLYLSSGCYDFNVLNYHVEYNGRQGLAGIGGARWFIDNFTVVNAGRFAIDLEPIGTYANGETRWISGVEIANSYLRAGVVLHRVSDITIRDSDMWKVTNLADNTVELSLKRFGIRILRNTWPDLWRPQTANAGPIRLSSVNGIEVRGNTVTRDPSHTTSVDAPLVEVIDLPVTGHMVVRDNVAQNFATLFKYRNGLTPPACVTTDVG
jgi:hypothetical protein